LGKRKLKRRRLFNQKGKGEILTTWNYEKGFNGGFRRASTGVF
jgi:hypothetical protein